MISQIIDVLNCKVQMMHNKYDVCFQW